MVPAPADHLTMFGDQFVKMGAFSLRYLKNLRFFISGSL